LPPQRKKNDRSDAGKTFDCLWCDFLTECHMASAAIRERRRTLRYRNLLVGLRCVACQVSPLTRFGEGAQASEAPIGRFPDWQKKKPMDYLPSKQRMRRS